VIRAAALLLLLSAAACSPEPVVQSQRAQEAEVQTAAAAMTGWQRVWNSPETTIASANQFGFRAPAYGEQPDAPASLGSPITLSRTIGTPRPNLANFAASGSTAERIDSLRFTLGVTDAAEGDRAAERFGTLIRDFLFQSKADGADAVQAAIKAGAPATGTLPGAAWALTPAPGPAGTRTITVTFTRPDAKSGTSSTS
jgi:hypothetical protein